MSQTLLITVLFKSILIKNNLNNKMIRHITFSSLFVEMKKDGYLKPFTGMQFTTNTIQDKYVVFEKDWIGDAYFKAMFIAKKAAPGISFSPNDMIALIFDEHDLLIKGYQINEVSESNEFSRRSELESMLSRGDISEKEYKEIGDLLYIKGEIPLDYLVNVDIPDKKRLEQLGLL